VSTAGKLAKRTARAVLKTPPGPAEH